MWCGYFKLLVAFNMCTVTFLNIKSFYELLLKKILLVYPRCAYKGRIYWTEQNRRRQVGHSQFLLASDCHIKLKHFWSAIFILILSKRRLFEAIFWKASATKLLCSIKLRHLIYFMRGSREGQGPGFRTPAPTEK